MHDATSEFIESIGLLLEEERFPRVAGRILGLLLITDDTCSLDELAAELQVTKASVSTNARLLESKGVIERVSRPGDRRDHYRAAPDLPHRTLQARVAKMTRVRAAIRTGRDTIDDASPVVRARLNDMIASYDLFLHVTSDALNQLARDRSESGEDRFPSDGVAFDGGSTGGNPSR